MLGQDGHEADDAGTRGLAREMIPGHQPDYFPVRADHDLCIKGKPVCEFGAELCPGNSLPNNKGAGRANADGIEVLQPLGELGRLKGPVTPDVGSSQQNHECHGYPLDDASGTADTSAVSTAQRLSSPASGASALRVRWGELLGGREFTLRAN